MNHQRKSERVLCYWLPACAGMFISLRRTLEDEKPVARMERCRIRDSYSASRSFLDYASLHPGYILSLFQRNDAAAVLLLNIKLKKY